MGREKRIKILMLETPTKSSKNLRKKKKNQMDQIGRTLPLAAAAAVEVRSAAGNRGPRVDG